MLFLNPTYPPPPPNKMNGMHVIHISPIKSSLINTVYWDVQSIVNEYKKLEILKKNKTNLNFDY